MIEDLNLTSREEKVLRSVVRADPSETVAQFVKRKGWRGILWLVMTISLGIGALIAMVLWLEGYSGENRMILLLLFLVTVDAILSPFKLRNELARDRLIRKLYHVLEAREGPSSSEDKK